MAREGHEAAALQRGLPARVHRPPQSPHQPETHALIWQHTHTVTHPATIDWPAWSWRVAGSVSRFCCVALTCLAF